MGRGQAYPSEVREQALRLVAESVRDGHGEWESIRAVAAQLGVGSSETVRKWVRRAQALEAHEGSKSAEESEELRRLRAEVRELRRANDILKAAAGFFAAEFDRPQRNG